MVKKKVTRRKPYHPGVILDEHYIKPLNLNLQKLADNLGISRNTLFKIRSGKANITPAIAFSLAKAFDTSPQLWLNLQQKYDLWMEASSTRRTRVSPILKDGSLVREHYRSGLIRNVGRL